LIVGKKRDSYESRLCFMCSNSLIFLEARKGD